MLSTLVKARRGLLSLFAITSTTGQVITTQSLVPLLLIHAANRTHHSGNTSQELCL